MISAVGERMSMLLIEAARAGVSPTIEQKILTITSIDEMNGFQAELARRGERLSTEDLRAVISRRNALRGAR